MPTVTITQGFTFQHDDGYKEYIPPGTYDVDDNMANHFQVLAHSDKPPPVRARPGMSQFEAQTSAFAAAETARTEQENQVAQAAADEARAAFRKANVETAAQRPNQRAQISPDAQAEQTEESTGAPQTGESAAAAQQQQTSRAQISPEAQVHTEPPAEHQ